MKNIPIKGEYLEILLRSKQTVFSTKDIALLWNESNNRIVTNRLKDYVKRGKIIRIHKGLYSKDNDYDRLELATRIYTPSYISFETVLTKNGVNFQYYSNIFVASYVNREIIVDNQKITFIRMKDYVLSNNIEIEYINNYPIATPERAFLDRLYISKDYHFDNLSNIDINKILKIVSIYNNKKLEKNAIRLFKT